MADLASMRFVNEAAVKDLWPELLFRYHAVNPRIPQPMIQGSFIP